VRARAEELKKSLDQVIVALEVFADRVHWYAKLQILTYFALRTS
jgi:hypothetical protein